MSAAYQRDFARSSMAVDGLLGGTFSMTCHGNWLSDGTERCTGAISFGAEFKRNKL